MNIPIGAECRYGCQAGAGGNGCPGGRTRTAATIGGDVLPAVLPADALDDRIAIVDPLGVWWGLRASADGGAEGYPVVVFGGHHADVPVSAEMGGALGRLALLPSSERSRVYYSPPAEPGEAQAGLRSRAGL